MAKKTHYGPDLSPLGPDSGRKFFFQLKIWLFQSLDIIMYNIRKNL